MLKRFAAGNRNGILLALFMAAIVAALAILPGQFTSSAGSTGKGLVVRTSVSDDGLPKMWDIREDKEQDENMLALRQMSGKDASLVADVRDRLVRGEVSFKEANPTAKVEYTSDLRNAEVLTPDVHRARFDWLTRPSSADRADILRQFVKGQSDLIGVTNEQADELVATADYQSPNDGLGWARLEQRIHGVPVFRGEINAGFTKNGEMIRAINNIAPGIDYTTVSRTFNDPANAVAVAAGHIKHDLRPSDLSRNDAASTDLKVIFGEGDWATTAEKMYFPTELGVAVPSWRILFWQPVTAYYVIVDAQTGIVLWHKNLGDDQTQSATYQVYTAPTSLINAADHATSLSPYGGPTSNPGAGTQGTLLTRSNVTLIGNEAPFAFNQLGWVTDGTNLTDGNSNEAGIDRVAPNGVDAAQPGDTACPGAGCRTFTSTWNPPPGAPTPGDDPLTAPAQRGAVIQMFYVMNRHHDYLYNAGFTEAARNFQNTNFTGMGLGNDRVSSEGQDSSGTNNANFATPADGGRGRMQMFLWTGPTPDRDGTADADIVIHEVSHGVSNRLIGNGTGLGNQGAMMGEGWGDWYAHTMLAEPTDDPLGIHGLGGYSLINATAGFTANHYYGIRRFPAAVMASTGGANNRPHNPLTFRHINAGCDTEIGTTTSIGTISAYPRGPFGTTNACSQVHNAGEIWKSALWEVRGRFIARRGFTSGTTAVLTAVTEGMKLTPVNPNMLQARDGIVAAAQALSASPQTSADAADVREGFRIRGMGFSASVQAAGAVTEAFDAPTLAAGSGAVVTSGNNLLEPNECNTLNIPLSNNSGATATGISAVLSSSTPGITVSQANSAYPDIPAGGANVNNTTPYQVSVANTVACYTSASFTLTVSYSGGGGGSPLVINFSLPVGQPGGVYTFATGTGGTIPAGGTLVTGSQADDAAVSVTLPAGWNSSVYDVAVTSLSASTNGTMAVNAVNGTQWTNTALPATGGTTSPTQFPNGVPILFPSWDDYDMDPGDTTNGGIFTNTVGTAPNREFYIEWRAAHFSEPAGSAISHNFAVKLTEGTSNVQYIHVLTGVGAQSNGVSSTVGIQKARAAGSPFTQFSFNTASTAPGMVITGTLPAGVCTPGSGTCGPVATPKPRADFDGDGKTDLSVFRATEGNWYLNRSTAGLQVLNFGVPTDVPVPGDYDGDGKADTAVFRVSANSADPDYYILNSSTFTVTGLSWGLPGDIPVAGGDYNGDGKTDLSVFRPSNQNWYVYNSGMGTATVSNFGLATDVPLAMDNDGDGKTNLAVFRPSTNTWYVAKPTGPPATNFDVYPFGSTGDLLAHADYDGDNKDDVAVFRPSNGTWYARLSTTTNTVQIPFGQSGDVPVPGDYDGNGTDDQAVYRNGTWFIRLSTGAVNQYPFGIATDIAVPSKYLPGGGAGGPGPGGEVTVSYTGAAVPIMDNVPAGVNVNLVVSGVGTVSDLNFRFDPMMGGTCDGTIGDTDCGVNHTWVGDLIFKLTPPDGSPTVTFIDRPGVPTTTFGCNNNNIGLVVINSDGALPAAETQCTASGDALLWPTGNFSPNNTLNVFDGENANGTWVLNVSDNATGDTGSLRRFSLIFNGAN